MAERFNWTLQDMARRLMLQSRLTTSFWTDAIATTCYIRNRYPTSFLDGEIPFEKWIGQSLNYDNLKTFGSRVFVLDKDPTKDKLSARSLEGVFVGYPRETKGFRVWIPLKHKTIVARDVRFLEEINDISKDSSILDNLIVENTTESNKELAKNPSHEYIDLFPAESITPILPDISSGTPHMPTRQCEDFKRAPGRPRFLGTGAKGRPRKLFRTQISSRNEADEDRTEADEEEAVNSNCVFTGIAEISVKEALEGENCEDWKKAVENEVLSLLENDTIEIVKRTQGQNVIGCRLVLTNKYRPDGQIERHKARLVAKGFSQRFGVDYHQTFAPVARLETVRTMIALAAELKLKVWQFDVVTVHLNGQLEKNVIMEMPEMLEEMLRRIVAKTSDVSEIRTRALTILKMVEDGRDACHLKRLLYGLRQAGRCQVKSKIEKLRA